MTNITDNDILMTKGNDRLYVDLKCGYGQPSVTTIYLKKNNGTTEKIKSFDNNTERLEIGRVDDLKFNEIDIHTTIHDVRDNPVEKEDISLDIKVYEKDSSSVDTGFTKKTKGKGTVFHSFYSVIIL